MNVKLLWIMVNFFCILKKNIVLKMHVRLLSANVLHSPHYDFSSKASCGSHNSNPNVAAI